VIGSDGRCKTCGRRASDAPGTEARAIVPGPGDVADVGGAAPAAASSEPDPVPTPCSDAACTGVAGTAGTCTVCGKVVP
jgi:hypothetical protein